jgi:hypothetical protein
LVETVTVAKLKAAGVTMAALRDPNGNLPPRLAASLSPSNQLALGTAIQACAGGLFGTLLAQGFARSTGNGSRIDAASRACVNTWFAASNHDAIVAKAVLNVDPTKADSAQIGDLIVTCLDVAALLQPAFHMTFTTGERACINQVARSSSVFRSDFASSIAGSSPSATTNEAMGATIVKCLTPAHILQIAHAKK